MEIRTPASRRTDPETSALAEEEINASGSRKSQQELVFRLVDQRPGHTAQELAQHTHLDRYQIQKRLSEMTGLKIRRGDAKKCSVTDRKASTWYTL